MLLFGIVFITLGSIAPDLKEKLMLSEIESGTLFSILPFGVLIGSLIFGPVVDKFGYKILLALSCVFMFAGFEGIAFASSKELIKIWILFISLGGGAINGATNALISDISDTNKGANLSLLGVFYGIGALGTPLILGMLMARFTYENIFVVVGALTVLVALLFILLKYPSPKSKEGFPLKHSMTLMKDSILWLIAFFLFFQSGFEGLVNNWTTLFLTDHLAVEKSNALYGLTLFVAGMMVMRLLLGSVFRSASVEKIMTASFALMITGVIILRLSTSFYPATAGLVVLGAGLGGGFPLMLGLVGERFSNLSGTAFSFTLVIALIGNTLINYCMGLVGQYFGIRHLTSVAMAETGIMIILFLLIIIKIRKNSKQIKTD